MKKRIIILFFLFISAVFYAQTVTTQYSNLIKKAEKYYYLKNYKQSATTYTLAFKANKWKALPDDRYNAACSWALANNKDSAFHQLNIIVTKSNYSDYEQITSEEDLKSLHKDKRWKPLLQSIQENKEKKEALLNKPLIKQLDSIYNDDQSLRVKAIEIQKKYGNDSKEMKQIWEAISLNDSINLIKVKNIIDANGWLGTDVIGEKGNQTLFLVIQHADQKTQEKYLPTMRDAVKKGNARASALALLEDRVALGQGKKQIYGSQILTDYESGKNKIAPIEDSINVNKRRAQVGLEPLEEYVKQWGIIIKKEEKTKTASKNSDFNSAIEIKDSIVGIVNTCKGYGKELEFKYGMELKEENSAWFKFTIDIDTILTFDIVPVSSNDDYDFILFKCAEANCIDKIKSGAARPDRSCFSVNYSKHGSTGLSKYTSVHHIGAGPGTGYTESVPVKAGETFYLMVNWPEVYHRTPKGFTIYFYNYWPHKPKEFPQIKFLNTKNITKPSIHENVLFESNKSILLEESKIVLNKLITEMQKNKNMKIEIIGHTDNTGDEKQNQKLSENRAKAVVDYLISKNIDKSRLSYKGLGSSKPIASNNTEEGKKKNRRVEFIILSK